MRSASLLEYAVHCISSLPCRISSCRTDSGVGSRGTHVVGYVFLFTLRELQKFDFTTSVQQLRRADAAGGVVLGRRCSPYRRQLTGGSRLLIFTFRPWLVCSSKADDLRSRLFFQPALVRGAPGGYAGTLRTQPAKTIAGLLLNMRFGYYSKIKKVMIEYKNYFCHLPTGQIGGTFSGLFQPPCSSGITQK